MLSTVIAIVGTLLGALLSGVLQQRVNRSEREIALGETRREAQISAVTALAVAVSDHRRAMWELRDAQLTNRDPARVQDLRDESHRTRSAVTEPAVRVTLLITDPAVRTAAQEAVQSTYRMRGARDLDQLETQRAAALTAHDAMVGTAAEHLAA